jgi:DHA1 family tetracycline resistance protein-like MFS transporter
MSRQQNAALTFIFITLLIDVIGIGIIIPVLPKLIVEVSGGSISNAALIGGLLIAAFSVMQFIFSPFLGNLSDHYGRRPILLISLFGFGLDYILMAYAPSLGWLFVGRIIAGIMGASFTTASAYIADVSPPEKRAQNFGLIGAAFGLGFIIGPFLGGWLGQFGTRVPFIGAAILTLLNWLFGFFILPESLPADKRRKFNIAKINPFNAFSSIAKFPVILGLVASLVVIYIASHATQSTWSFFTIERFQWEEKEVGYSLAVVGILVSIVQGLLIRVINPKLGAERSVYVGILLYALGFFLFSFATEGWMMFVFLIPYCLGGISGPALQGIMSSQVPDNQQGELQGALTSLISLTSIVGPLVMTAIFSYFTQKNSVFYFPGAAFFLGGALSLLSGYLAHRTLKKHR